MQITAPEQRAGGLIMGGWPRNSGMLTHSEPDVEHGILEASLIMFTSGLTDAPDSRLTETHRGPAGSIRAALHP